jgi:hypothetical protein
MPIAKPLSGSKLAELEAMLEPTVRTARRISRLLEYRRNAGVHILREVRDSNVGYSGAAVAVL